MRSIILLNILKQRTHDVDLKRHAVLYLNEIGSMKYTYSRIESLRKEIFEIIIRINKDLRTTILLVEQNANIALNNSHFGYVLELGRIVMEGDSKDLLEKEDIKEFYLGQKDEGVRGERRWKKKKMWR